MFFHFTQNLKDAFDANPNAEQILKIINEQNIANVNAITKILSNNLNSLMQNYEGLLKMVQDHKNNKAPDYQAIMQDVYKNLADCAQANSIAITQIVDNINNYYKKWGESKKI